MPTLSAYSNVENTALIILKKKGYNVWLNKSDNLYFAERNGWDFCANSITELLGLIGIYEYHNPKNYREYWWMIKDEWLLNDLPDRSPQYKSVCKRKK